MLKIFKGEHSSMTLFFGGKENFKLFASSLIILNGSYHLLEEKPEKIYEVVEVSSQPITEKRNMEIPNFVKNPMNFSVDFVPVSDEVVRAKIKEAITRNDVYQRIGLDGALYGNLFTKYPELTDTILEASDRFTVNPFFLAAVIMQESGNGTSNALYERNNTSGMRCVRAESLEKVRKEYPKFGNVECMSIDEHGEYAVFDSIKDSIIYTAWTLRENYLNKGLTTVRSIGEIYAPIDDEGDIENLNKEWIPSIKSRLNQFGLTNVE